MSDALLENKIDKLKERREVPLEDRWDVEAIYPSWNDWQNDLDTWVKPQNKPHWPEFNQYKGKLSQPSSLLEFIERSLLVDRHLSKLYTYAHLKHDEDVSEEKANQEYTRMVAFLYEYKEELSWFEPELLSLSQSQIDNLTANHLLAPYKNYLLKILRFKPYTLSKDEERLMALSGRAMETAQRAFGVFNNADVKFTPAKDSSGRELEMSHGKYHLYLRSKDRDLRRSAFQSMHSAFMAYENTLCELIQGQVQRHLFEKKARGYKSCLHAALFPHEVDESVYKSLISTVNQNLSSLHNYMGLRKKVLGFDNLHLYDVYVPMVSDVNFSISYEDAEKMVVDSVSILGDEYQNALKRGLSTDRWVDRYENARKRSGAYSSGCYDTRPYILMNYHGTLNDAMTLTHEAGHSMHSYMSCKNQPYQYSHYPIFLAEVASTFHEELLLQHLLAKVESKEQKAYLINQKIDDIRATFFRQTMFAEFELKIHELVEQDVPLTPAMLKQLYRDLNLKYFGDHMKVDEEIDIEWARIPHFYYNFYVYQYATGLSASCALAERVLSGEKGAKEQYLTFLSSGSSKFPLDTLADAGVDMRSSKPVEALIAKFNMLVAELQVLLA